MSARSAGLHPSAAAAEAPLVTFRVVRSFAGGHHAAAAAAPAARPVAAAVAARAAAGGGILSFQEVSLELGPLDFTAHESFLAAVYSFALQLPLDDVWQVRAPTCAALCRVSFSSARAAPARPGHLAGGHASVANCGAAPLSPTGADHRPS